MGGASSTLPAKAAIVDVLQLGAILERIFAHYRNIKERPAPTTECLRLIGGRGPADVEAQLARLPPEWADHAVACVYALLMPHERRKRLGVYFTPPHLVEHLLRRMCALGLDPARHRIEDRSAGGAAFLVPLARKMTSNWTSQRVASREIVARLRARLRGREVDPGLATVANALLRRMLVREFGIDLAHVKDLSLVRVGDGLSTGAKDVSDHELGNPPYLRLDAKAQCRWRKHFPDIVSGRLNLYAMFVRRALDEVPARGLIGYVVPASFLGGPEFAAFRRRVLRLAEVLVVDVIEKRSNVFLDAVQDACFVVLRRRPRPLENVPTSQASSGLLRHSGEFVENELGALLPADGTPWSLPGAGLLAKSATLADYGYRGTVGHLVANREPHRLHKRSAKGRLPLAWAKCITSDGRFDFDRGRKAKNARGRGFVSVPDKAPYAVHTACVLVQRTSASSQLRRLTAAPVPSEFLRMYGGIVGENHVILLVPTRADAVPSEELAAVLNGPAANAAMARVCGSASISVRVLEQLPLPAPASFAVELK